MEDLTPGRATDPVAAPRRTGPGGWLLLAALVCAGVLTWFADSGAGPPASPARGYLVGALVAVASGGVVLAGPRFGVSRTRGAHVAPVRLVGALMVARGASWLLFAFSAARGGLGVPDPGDLVNPVTGIVGIGLVAAVSRQNRPAAFDGLRRRLLVLDVTMTTCTTMLALWVLVFGPALSPPSGRPAAAGWVVVLTTVYVVQLATGILVFGSSGAPHTGPTLLALTLITLGDLVPLLTAVDGSRELPVAALAVWSAGWVLLAREVLRNRSPRASSGRAGAPAGRPFAVGSTLVVGFAAVGVLAAVLAWGTGTASPSDDPMVLALMLCSLGAFVLREWWVGRERLRLVADLADQAVLDPLTRLTNRRGLTERLRDLPAGSEWAVLALDLDGFKGVNDVHGHARGDAVLAAVADVLRTSCPGGGLAARTGGDEFAMLVAGDVERGRRIGLDVVAAVPRALAPLVLAVPITASVGVGRLVRRSDVARPDDVPDADPLTPLVEASAALRAAKAGGRNRVQVYPGHVARQRERRLLVETRLRRAIVADELTTVGQPLVDLSTRRPVSVEALARWDDAVLRSVPPAEFVAVAEDAGLVIDLGRHVLRSAFTGFASCGSAADGMLLGVNASPIQLRDHSFAWTLRDLLDETGLTTAQVVVEVTEAVLVEADDPALRVLGDLGDLGVRIAIDDFGSGYSALGYLRRLPVSTVKLDRSLIHEARTTVRTRHVLAGLVDLAHRLGVVVVVEGIEDDHAARLAVELGADVGQGYLLGRPAPWDELAARIRADGARVVDVREARAASLVAPEDDPG